MDKRTRDEIQEALSSADRAIRLAEKALLRTPVDEPARDEPESKAESAEQALSDYLFGAVGQAKTFEEQDPQSFRARFAAMKNDLLRFVLSKQVYQEGPRGSGTAQLDPTDATTAYEKCLKAGTEYGINQTELMEPFVDDAHLKNWGDVLTGDDLVVMRYETPGMVTVNLDSEKLARLVAEARKVPGAVDRIQMALREEGTGWDVSTEAGTLVHHLDVSGIKGQWAACIKVVDIATNIAGRLAVVEVNYDSPQEGWWDAARIDHNLPNQLLPIIRGKERRIICQRSEIRIIQDWATKLPGWNSDADTASTPLTVHKADYNDILN